MHAEAFINAIAVISKDVIMRRDVYAPQTFATCVKHARRPGSSASFASDIQQEWLAVDGPFVRRALPTDTRFVACLKPRP